MAFAHLIRVWHARNGWSHRVLPALAEALDLGRVHNSQLSMLRNGKLASPGPEVFLALGELNRWLAEHAPDGRLVLAAPNGDGPSNGSHGSPGVPPPGLAALADHPEVTEALAISAQPVRDEAGRVLGAGELLEVFVGLRLPPPAFDLRIDEAEAPALSGALAMLLTAGRPWRQCREQLLEAYPVGKRQRRQRFAEVMAGQSDYGADELDAELPDLRRTLAALGVAGEQELGPARFLELLREKARLQGQAGLDGIDLAEAIRRELGGTDQAMESTEHLAIRSG